MIERRKLFAALAGAGAGTAIVLGAISYIEGCDRPAQYAMLQSQVAELLASPGSAVFAPIETAMPNRTHCNVRVEAWVDSQNRMGAVLRSNFVGYVSGSRKDGYESFLLSIEER